MSKWRLAFGKRIKKEGLFLERRKRKLASVRQPV